MENYNIAGENKNIGLGIFFFFNLGFVDMSLRWSSGLKVTLTKRRVHSF